MSSTYLGPLPASSYGAPFATFYRATGHTELLSFRSPFVPFFFGPLLFEKAPGPT